MPLDDGDDERHQFRPPLPPEDRVWRHPSELTGPERERSAMSTRRFGLGAVAVAAVAGATATLGVLAAVGKLGGDHRDAQSDPRPPASLTVSRVATRADASVAGVEAITAAGPVAASAVVLRRDGYLLTSRRSVAGAKAVRVTLPDRRDVPADVTGSDPLTGVAVVHVDADDLQPAPMGESDKLKVGSPTVAVAAAGSPDDSALTRGVVSGLDQRATREGTTFHGLVGTDRSFPRRSDGAPLLDQHGQVTGMVVWMNDRRSGYAVPIDQARRVAAQIIETGHPTYPWLGVSGHDLSTSQAMALGVPGGAQITEVMDDSPAHDAGLRVGDVVTRLDRKPLMSMSALITQVRADHPGAKVRLTVARGHQTLQMTVRLTAKTEH